MLAEGLSTLPCLSTHRPQPPSVYLVRNPVNPSGRRESPLGTQSRPDYAVHPAHPRGVFLSRTSHPSGMLEAAANVPAHSPGLHAHRGLAGAFARGATQGGHVEQNSYHRGQYRPRCPLPNTMVCDQQGCRTPHRSSVEHWW